MPVADSFIDTNILLYAISTEPAEAGKTAIARRLLTTENWGWSAQVYDGVRVVNPFVGSSP